MGAFSRLGGDWTIPWVAASDGASLETVTRPRLPTQLAALVAVALAALAAVGFPADARGAGPDQISLPSQARLASDRAVFRALAVRGVKDARTYWWNSRLQWYNDRLNDTDTYPLVTIWGGVHLFEAVDAIAIANPTAANRTAVDNFAKVAERYWDPALQPSGGYAPYRGDRGGRERAWFDDNGWWGIAFEDAYRATGNKRYITDAAGALRFINKAGWAPDGGLWWDTTHPWKAGEAIASGTVLAAMLYEDTGQASYLKIAHKFITWADAHLWNGSLYVRSDKSPDAMSYVEGPMIGANEILCRKAGDSHACSRMEQMAERSLQGFGTDLNHGPQFDSIYLRWMLQLYRHDGDSRWYALAYHNAQRAVNNARDSRGLFQRAWDGGSIARQLGRTGQLQGQGASVSLLAWLAEAPIPGG
jgi:hypothetical protein